ncbi:MAG: hypothetical protein JJE46_04500 [Acidimicrobiia bacterium]|nr:hypothetical protein [Acidimicrobiia bacterium]
MKKFIYLYSGTKEPTTEVRAQWEQWFAQLGPAFVDSGNPFGPGREVTATGSRELTPDLAPATGYSIVAATSMDEAEQLLEGCPVAEGVRIYEALPM